jgi:hypothetical protein
MSKRSKKLRRNKDAEYEMRRLLSEQISAERTLQNQLDALAAPMPRSIEKAFAAIQDRKEQE